MIACLAFDTGIAPSALLNETDEMLTTMFGVLQQRSKHR
jgi:hypothetical protein